MTRIELNIADDLASKAQEAGLLDQTRIESLLREELRREAGKRLGATMAKLHAIPGEPMPMDEINGIVKEVRRERREREARR